MVSAHHTENRVSYSKTKLNFLGIDFNEYQDAQCVTIGRGRGEGGKGGRWCEIETILISAHHDALIRLDKLPKVKSTRFSYLLLVFIRNENFLCLFLVRVSVQRLTALDAVDFCKSREAKGVRYLNLGHFFVPNMVT